MNITMKNGHVNINGKTFVCRSISIENGCVMVDGIAQDEPLKAGDDIHVSVNGSVEELKTTSGDVTISGPVGRVRTQSGSVHCNNVNGDVNTMSGSVALNRSSGNIKTMSGKVTHAPLDYVPLEKEKTISKTDIVKALFLSIILLVGLNIGLWLMYFLFFNDVLHPSIMYSISGLLGVMSSYVVRDYRNYSIDNTRK